jgi:acyl-coenzyme A synthetase/AMP-(fatty) acid ligase
MKTPASLPPETGNSNAADYLTRAAERYPSQWALLSSRRMTFSQLQQEVDRCAHGLKRLGITQGCRTILLVKPGLEFFVLIYALFRTGAVPVLIDPGVGVKVMGDSLAKVNAGAFIGIPRAHLLRIIYPGVFKRVKIRATPGQVLSQHSPQGKPYPPCPLQPGDLAAIFFTSGSTGPPKGVIYHQAVLDAQLRYLQSHYQYGPGKINLCTFPLFGFFSISLGMTTVLADMDPAHPASVDPRGIVANIREYGCTDMFCSPMLMERLARYGVEKGVELPSLRRVVTAGAPVRPQLLESFKKLLKQGTELHVSYGATEALPVTDITASQLLRQAGPGVINGDGTCVGRALAGMEIRVIEIGDQPIDSWEKAPQLPAGAIGEIVVKGPVVTHKYLEAPQQEAEAKIYNPPAGGIWHRMGDVGYLDREGRLWFCGRKAQRVVTAAGTLFTVPCEAIFNRHPRVFRSALVGVPTGTAGPRKPVLCVQLEPGDPGRDKKRLINELLEIGAAYPSTRDIKHILFPGSFPVDARHNAKIFREKLARWASRRVK